MHSTKPASPEAPPTGSIIPPQSQNFVPPSMPQSGIPGSGSIIHQNQHGVPITPSLPQSIIPHQSQNGI